jgi:uncharacterized protein YutE (UPF0331/DUF86 family)
MKLFITDQHRQQIQVYFAVMNQYTCILQKLAVASRESFLNDEIMQSAGERALHIALECATDTGNLIIDALIMRDASSYEDIIQVLAEEDVFPSEFSHSFMELVRYRRILVHDYLQRDPAKLYTMITTHTQQFSAFQAYIADYVKLG